MLGTPATASRRHYLRTVVEAVVVVEGFATVIDVVFDAVPVWEGSLTVVIRLCISEGLELVVFVVAVVVTVA